MAHTKFYSITGGCWNCGCSTARINSDPLSQSETYICNRCGAHPAPRKIKVQHLPNVRFWTWINNGWVKLTLKPGQCLDHSKGGRTDEGWSRSCRLWEYDWEGSQEPLETADIVIREESTYDGCDCDGRISYQNDSQWDGKTMTYRHDEFAPPGNLQPHWTDVRQTQRDYAAEAAGY